MSGVSLGVSGHRGRIVTSDQSDTDNSDLEVDTRHRGLSTSPNKDSGYRWVIRCNYNFHQKLKIFFQ